MSSYKLPENAGRELKDGEKYIPVMDSSQNPKEITPYSVITGVVMAVIFSAAAAYLGLKIGQVFEAAIPIAIIAVGMSAGLKRKNALGENVIIQSIGASSGVIVAGAIFTLPALYILQDKYPEMTVNFMQVFLSSLLGGCLGILFLIPFRKYFVSDMHGKYPFPEATATTQVLIQTPADSEEGKEGDNESTSSTKTLVVAAVIGGIYDFLVSTFGLWTEQISTRMLSFGEHIAAKTKLVFSMNTSAAVLGLGYIIGLKYAAIICAGSFFVWWFIIPLLGMTTVDSVMLSDKDPQWIFTNYARYIGIGAIAMAGVLGIIKSWGVIKSALGLAKNELSSKGKQVATSVLRTEKDLSMKFLLISVVAALVLVFLFFYIGVIHNFWQALIAWLVVTFIAFLFTTVAANAIAIVGSNPVSGMTLMTLIIASVVLVAVGLKGTTGIVASMVIGGVVCTALSMAGGFITDLKIGYWLGSTPQKQEKWKFLGTLVSAATVGVVIIILNDTYGFTGDNALVAPQANAMAAVIEPLMMGQGAPWLLYGIGAVLALILNFLGVPVLPFALGMFIPLQLNTPLLVGGFIAWLVSKGSDSKDSKIAQEAKQRYDKGTLIASGFIAGGALMGVVSAAIRFAGADLYIQNWAESWGAELLAVFTYLILVTYFIISSKKVKTKI